MADPPASNPVFQALRIAVACSLCLILVLWLQLEHANLAVWTTYLVMAVVPITVFQRGLERSLGRGLGIIAAVAMVSIFPDSMLVRLFLGSLLLVAVFYGYFANRLSYAVINGALYFSVLVELAQSDPATVAHQGWEMFLAVLFGCLVSDVVVWITRSEAGLHLDFGTQPLFPIRNDWLNRAVMMVVTILVTIQACRYFLLPLQATIISVMIITGNPDVHTMLVKGEMRLGGVLAGGGYGIVVFFILSLVPYFSVFVVLIFLGTFVSGYLSKVLGQYAYFGAQLGLVICLTTIVRADEFGSVEIAIQRGIGVLLAMTTTILIAGFWPGIPYQAATGNTATPPVGAGRG